jgi:DNA-binding MarR family transcriptional regulator
MPKSEEDKSTIRRLYKVVDAMRKVDSTLPMQTFAAFLVVALDEGMNVSQIGERVGIAQSSASRNVATLSDWDYTKKTGLKLVEYRTDPMNLSTKTVHLSNKGGKLVDEILTALKGRAA